MMFLKHEYLPTHIIEKVESVNMSDSGMYSNEEEEQMVAQVGGRGGIWFKVLLELGGREREGRAQQNLQQTPDIRMRPRI